MNLERLIEQMLVRHDCVIVPGLGGFVVQREHATLRGDVLTAPCARVSFNAELRHTDGLLASELARRSGVGYRDASAQIEAWAHELTGRLGREQNVVLGALGRMTMSEGGHIRFLPAEAAFLPDNLGLSPISLSPIVKPQAVRMDVAATPRASWHRVAAVVISVLAMWGLSNLNEPVSSFDVASAGLMEWGRPLPVAGPMAAVETADVFSEAAVSESAEADGTFEAAAEAAAEDGNEADLLTPAAQDEPADEVSAYRIIVASLDKSGAENYARKLGKAGHETIELIETRRGQYYVCVGGFDDYNQALARMRDLRANDSACSHAWLLRR